MGDMLIGFHRFSPRALTSYISARGAAAASPCVSTHAHSRAERTTLMSVFFLLDSAALPCHPPGVLAGHERSRLKMSSDSSTIIPLDDRFALDPRRQCLIARTSCGEVVFRVYPREGLCVDNYHTVLTVRGEKYNASGGYTGANFWVSNIRPVEWLVRKPASRAACAAVTKLVEEAHKEAQRRGHLHRLETHATHWWASAAVAALTKEREDLMSRLAEIEGEETLATGDERRAGLAVAALEHTR